MRWLRQPRNKALASGVPRTVVGVSQDAGVGLTTDNLEIAEAIQCSGWVLAVNEGFPVGLGDSLRSIGRGLGGRFLHYWPYFILVGDG
jgi:hypothetical protein